MDGWLVRFSPGKAKRARCVQAVAAGRLGIDDKIAACEPIFTAAGLPMVVRITPFSLPQALDAALAERGWSMLDDTRVMVLPRVDDVRPRPLAELQLHAVGLEAFARRVGGLRGSPLSQQQAQAERLVNSPVPFFAFEATIGGDVVGCGQFALEGDLVGLYDVFVAPEVRGRGVAGAMCARLLELARERGARVAYLQVEGDNTAARAVYRRLGFEDAYAYHYRQAPSHPGA